MNSRDPRVVQLRESCRFRAEAFDDSGVGEIGIEYLDGDFTIERDIDRSVHRSHGATSELPDDAILSDRLSNHSRPVVGRCLGCGIPTEAQRCTHSHNSA